MTMGSRTRRQAENAVPDQLLRTRQALAEARRRFDQTREPELIEACIFEMNALQARCAWLQRRLREAEA